MGDLQFYPFTSLVETSFWDLLIKNKVDLYKLNNEPIDLVGTYRIGRCIFLILKAFHKFINENGQSFK